MVHTEKQLLGVVDKNIFIKPRDLENLENIPVYNDPQEFKADLETIKASLDEDHDQAVTHSFFTEILEAIDVFGFHLATIDMRQDSSVNEACVAELLKSAGICDDYSDLSEDERSSFCLMNLKMIHVIYMLTTSLSLNCCKRIKDLQDCTSIKGSLG